MMLMFFAGHIAVIAAITLLLPQVARLALSLAASYAG